MQRIVREVLEGKVLDADVNVHRLEVAEGAVVLEREAATFRECCCDFHVAGRVVVDVLAAHRNCTYLVVERADDGVVRCCNDGVLHE